MSTKTLYNYVDLGLMDIKNIDLPEKVKSNTKARRVRANKRILGRSMDKCNVEDIEYGATLFLERS